MARYKFVDTSPRFLPVLLSQQLLPGTFEHALNYLLDHEIDLTELDQRYRNDMTGAPAYPPTVLLKLILFTYSRGIASSHTIEKACRENGTCIYPAGKKLYGNGSHCVIGGYAAVKFQGAQRDCEPCAYRQKCLRTPEQTKTRLVTCAKTNG